MNQEILLLVTLFNKLAHQINGDTMTFTLPVVMMFVTNAVGITVIYVTTKVKLDHIIKTMDGWNANRSNPEILKQRLDTLSDDVIQLEHYTHDILTKKTDEHSNWFIVLAQKLGLEFNRRSSD